MKGIEKTSFQFEPALRNTGLLIIFLSLFLEVIGFILSIRYTSFEQWYAPILGLMPALPFLLFGFYFFFRHSGQIIVEKDFIELRIGKKNRKLNFSDIIRVREFDRNLPSGITFYTKDNKLSFSRKIPDFASLYNLLTEKLPLLKKKIEYPYVLNAKRWFQVNLYGSIAFIYSLFAIIYVTAPPQKNVTEALLMIFGCATFFALLVLPLALPGRKKPVKVTLYSDKIELQNFYNKITGLQREQINKLELKNVYKSARGIQTKELAILITAGNEDFTLTEHFGNASGIGLPGIYRILREWQSA